MRDLEIRQAIDRGERELAEQAKRIARQRERIATLAHERHHQRYHQSLGAAEAQLKSMLEAVAALQDELEDVRKRLTGRVEPLNEEVMDEVARNCPL